MTQKRVQEGTVLVSAILPGSKDIPEQNGIFTKTLAFSPYPPFSFFSYLSVQNLSSSINKAVAYLENRLPSLTYSYAVAMTSYALANANKLNKKKLMDFASAGVVTQQYFLANTLWSPTKNNNMIKTI